MVDRLSGLEEMIESVFPGVDILRLPAHRLETTFFVRGKLPMLSCWRAKDVQKWQTIKEEPLRKTALGEIGLRVELRMDPHLLRKRVAFGVRRALQIDPTLRQKSVRWIVHPQKRLQAKLSRSLDWLWNGMRNLPYSDDDIAEAVGLCFGLHRLGFAEADHEEAEHIAASLLGEVVKVEFGSWEGSNAQGFACAVDLRKAVRDDIERRLLMRYRKHASFVQPLLQLCSAPNRLFPFSRFVHVFGRQIVPTQVLRPEGQVSFFSPTRLEGFGLP